jgi:undecaprenyl-diphosphatase
VHTTRSDAGRFAGRSAAGLVALVGGATALAGLLYLASGPLVALDHAVADGLNRVVAPRPWLVAALEVATLPGATATGWIVLTTLTLALLARRQRRLALFTAVTGLGGAILGPGIKEVVGRLRPVVDAPVLTAPGPSFPSGHTLTVTVWVGTVLLVLLPAVPDHRRRAVVVAGGALVLLVGLTRIALGVHFLTDVVAGWLLGIGWLAVTTTAFRTWRREEGLPVVPPDDGLAPEAARDLEPAPDPGRPPAHPWELVARLLVTAVMLLGVVVGAGLLVTRAEAGAAVETADVETAEWFVDQRTEALDAVSGPAAELGNTGVVIGVGVVAAVLALAVLRRWRPVLLLAVVLLGELAIFMTATAIVDRPRPPVPHLDPELPPTSSFPSGHVAASICLYGAIAALVLRAARAWWRWLVLGVAVAVVVAVALARLYRGAHFPTDVLGSVLFAVPWLLVTLRLLRVDEAAPAEPPVRTPSHLR